jgi:hypothetical protein
VGPSRISVGACRGGMGQPADKECRNFVKGRGRETLKASSRIERRTGWRGRREKG